MRVIKKISIEQLRPGMFVHELSIDWFAHPFLRNRFLLKNTDDLQRIIDAGVRELYIDTGKGLDLADAPTREEVDAQLTREVEAIASTPVKRVARVAVAEELGAARRIRDQAKRAVSQLMTDVRLGNAVSAAAAEPIADAIAGSLMRSAGALHAVLGLKAQDEYTFLHSVSVAALLYSFGHHLEMPPEVLRELTIGGLLHDLGKAKVPLNVLNKPGRLTDPEFALIKRHPGDGHAALVQSGFNAEIPLTIVRHHHERIDGNGYPDRLAGAAISVAAQMGAICDVYDAITSDRCYHRGMPPTEALKRMYEWSKFHLDAELFQTFMRCIGIYPVGSLVRLESGRLGVVIEQNEGKLLQPKLRVIFRLKDKSFLPPKDVDLLHPGQNDRVLGAVNPRDWNIDIARFL